MPVPDYQTLMLPVLKCVSDGQEHASKELRQKISKTLQLSDEDLAERLPSGIQSTFDNRVGWATTYLKKSGLLISPKRGVILITDRGRDVLRQNPERIDTKFLEQFKEYQDFKVLRRYKSGTDRSNDVSSAELTPEEILENSYHDLRSQLADEILERVMQCSPEFFENLVVDLLVAMGYGGSRSDAGKAVGKSGDDGIDGIIKEDRLGLDVVNIQAKRWQNTVGRPEIQAFVGSLAGNRAKKGVFITTSKFSKEADDYVRRIEQKVVLIGGEQLAQLMIDYDIGVSKEAQYVVKKIDYDYFESN
ncbi:MAG: restriction endonuclease [Methanomicrobiaceae archaeon]|nr:restriction endonuclease [Methanomicrobiaceae archaeon]